MPLPSPLLSTFCFIIARLLSLPFRLIRCGEASGEGSRSPTAGSAPAATREKERPLPAGRSPADARTGRCALRSVPSRAGARRAGGSRQDRRASHHPARHLRGGRTGTPKGGWGEGGGDGGMERARSGSDGETPSGNPLQRPYFDS